MPDTENPPPSEERKLGQDSLADGPTTLAEPNLQLRLLQILLAEQIVSPAQAQLLMADHEVTGMTVDELVLARGWVSEQKLDQIAPWRKEPVDKSKSLRVSAGSKNYQQNFKQYRTLLERILGVSWD